MCDSKDLCASLWISFEFFDSSLEIQFPCYMPGVQMFRMASWQEIVVCHSAVYADRFSEKYAMWVLKMLQEGPTQKPNAKTTIGQNPKTFQSRLDPNILFPQDAF